MPKIFPKTWDSKEHEQKIYDDWEKSGSFAPEINMGSNPQYNRAENKPFVISIPPPNITGKLHVGHALFVSLEDLMIRYHRHLGEPALWVPGTDHAGIATQTVVDKMLKKQGTNRFEIGRDKFVDEVWKWKEEYGGHITGQLRRLGASCDWKRERFTLDEGLSKAVNRAFIQLYEKGLIYRGEYIVNWCPKCGTAIADDEVEYQEQKGKLYYFCYDKNFPITIATTRPETKLGDTAVAVNPKDDRYKQFVGKEYKINLDGIERTIKIIADRTVDPAFGTGAVGVTPAHSSADWKMAEEHNLEKIKVIDERGRIGENGGKYQGMKALEAREKLLDWLRAENLLQKEEEIDNNLSTCYRCNTAIEPLPSLQWFIKIAPLAERAKEAVKSGQIKIVPKRFEKIYFNWLDNIQNWCISRQLWWGHRIPVWYKDDQIHVGDDPGEDWTQDEDVLDTWFSSALWPFSTLGWPDNTSDLKYFFPTSVMETGYDILFFWVARMIMMSLELTDKIPFETVYLHGLIRDEHNRKMSKSLGNVMDPTDIIDKYGTDALRFSVVVGSTPGQDTAIGESKIKGYRNFSNKIWNASRFVALRVTEGDLATGELGKKTLPNLDIDKNILSPEDTKILENLEATSAQVTKYLNNYKFSLAGEDLYAFFWHDFCDIYIEYAKENLNENTKKILIKVLIDSLTMLHPFMPFVTEAVWQELKTFAPLFSERLITAPWPK